MDNPNQSPCSRCERHADAYKALKCNHKLCETCQFLLKECHFESCRPKPKPGKFRISPSLAKKLEVICPTHSKAYVLICETCNAKVCEKCLNTTHSQHQFIDFKSYQNKCSVEWENYKAIRQEAKSHNSKSSDLVDFVSGKFFAELNKAFDSLIQEVNSTKSQIIQSMNSVIEESKVYALKSLEPQNKLWSRDAANKYDIFENFDYTLEFMQIDKKQFLEQAKEFQQTDSIQLNLENLNTLLNKFDKDYKSSNKIYSLLKIPKIDDQFAKSLSESGYYLAEGEIQNGNYEKAMEHLELLIQSEYLEKYQKAKALEIWRTKILSAPLGLSTTFKACKRFAKNFNNFDDSVFKNMEKDFSEQLLALQTDETPFIQQLKAMLRLTKREISGFQPFGNAADEVYNLQTLIQALLTTPVFQKSIIENGGKDAPQMLQDFAQMLEAQYFEKTNPSSSQVIATYFTKQANNMEVFEDLGGETANFLNTLLKLLQEDFAYIKKAANLSQALQKALDNQEIKKQQQQSQNKLSDLFTGLMNVDFKCKKCEFSQSFDQEFRVLIGDMDLLEFQVSIAYETDRRKDVVRCKVAGNCHLRDLRHNICEYLGLNEKQVKVVGVRNNEISRYFNDLDLKVKDVEFGKDEQIYFYHFLENVEELLLLPCHIFSNGQDQCCGYPRLIPVEVIDTIRDISVKSYKKLRSHLVFVLQDISGTSKARIEKEYAKFFENPETSKFELLLKTRENDNIVQISSDKVNCKEEFFNFIKQSGSDLDKCYLQINIASDVKIAEMHLNVPGTILDYQTNSIFECMNVQEPIPNKSLYDCFQCQCQDRDINSFEVKTGYKSFPQVLSIHLKQNQLNQFGNTIKTIFDTRSTKQGISGEKETVYKVSAVCKGKPNMLLYESTLFDPLCNIWYMSDRTELYQSFDLVAQNDIQTSDVEILIYYRDDGEKVKRQQMKIDVKEQPGQHFFEDAKEEDNESEDNDLSYEYEDYPGDDDDDEYEHI